MNESDSQTRVKILDNEKRKYTQKMPASLCNTKGCVIFSPSDDENGFRSVWIISCWRVIVTSEHPFPVHPADNRCRALTRKMRSNMRLDSQLIATADRNDDLAQ